MTPTFWRGVLDASADLLFGAQCPGCRCPGWGICASCAQQLVARVYRTTRPGLALEVDAALRYTGPVTGVIPAYKDGGQLRLAGHLSGLLATSVASAMRRCGQVDAIVPLPSSNAAVRERGDDHMLRLARAASRRLRGPAVRRLLRRRGRSADQAGLTHAERQANLVGTMSAVPGAERVVLCDDVLTTGASMTEGVSALTAAGHSVVGLAVIAETPRRKPR